jgi:hypothetical protein
MDGEVMGRRPEVELTSGGMALEAAVAVSRQIDPELAALGMLGSMYRAGTTQPTTVAAAGDKA